uniref:Uncharacterized protein n=1 Tax=Chaetoceros debilis TaxID=122233 RepID=A0A7S3Q9B8_9STRA
MGRERSGHIRSTSTRKQGSNNNAVLMASTCILALLYKNSNAFILQGAYSFTIISSPPGVLVPGARTSIEAQALISSSILARKNNEVYQTSSSSRRRPRPLFMSENDRNDMHQAEEDDEPNKSSSSSTSSSSSSSAYQPSGRSLRSRGDARKNSTATDNDDEKTSRTTPSTANGHADGTNPDPDPATSASTSSSSSSTSRRPHRTEQIEKLQGIWWTSEQKDQLVQINSSYATFDAPQRKQGTSTSTNNTGTNTASPPAVVYPLGGTDEIVTLRTFKLLPSSTSTTSKSRSRRSSRNNHPHHHHHDYHHHHDDNNGDGDGDISPQWISSPVSQDQASRQEHAMKISSCSTWERCTDPQRYWMSERQQPHSRSHVIPGYEPSLITLMMNGGPHWSSSPVDVVRACIKGVQIEDFELLSSLHQYYYHYDVSDVNSVNVNNPISIGAEKGQGRGGKGMGMGMGMGMVTLLTNFTSISSWSIVKYHHYSPDVCIVHVELQNNSNHKQSGSGGGGIHSNHHHGHGNDDQRSQSQSQTQTCCTRTCFEFCLSRDMQGARRESKLPPSLLFDSMTDIELCVKGKVWAIDHVHMLVC